MFTNRPEQSKENNTQFFAAIRPLDLWWIIPSGPVKFGHYIL